MANAAAAANGLTPAAAAGEPIDKRPWDATARHAAETWIRNVGWMDPHPEFQLENDYSDIDRDELAELLVLAAELAAREAGVLETVNVGDAMEGGES